MDQQYLTLERLEELRAELQELKTAGRIEISERLKRAKELGDLSENSEYFEAREEQGHIETRIFELEEMVKNARVIAKSTGNTVRVGTTLEVEREGGTRLHFTIVGSNEAKPEAGLISNESPLGSAFLNREVGAVVKIKAPKGEMTYKILKIE